MDDIKAGLTNQSDIQEILYLTGSALKPVLSLKDTAEVIRCLAERTNDEPYACRLELLINKVRNQFSSRASDSYAADFYLYYIHAAFLLHLHKLLLRALELGILSSMGNFGDSLLLDAHLLLHQKKVWVLANELTAWYQDPQDLQKSLDSLYIARSGLAG
ncbi:MAG: hypothetical protein WCD37_10750 [Chloroflexia bacterium]